MATILFFVVLQLLASGYSCWRGGAPERMVAIMMALAFAATILSPLMPGYTYYGLNWPLLGVDLVLLAALVGVALLADRFWPMWIAALQLVAIGAHLVKVYDPHILSVAYWWLTGKLGYPMLLILVVGTLRHWRRRASAMPEWAWTWQRVRHERGAALARYGGQE